MFPLIQGILAFDTPYNGLARPMFVYGAFSNYSKVSSVFNVMTALSAAPASLSMALKRGATSLPGPKLKSAAAGPAAWKTWQLLAVRTGTVGAIAAGGVAAYVHRKKIYDGVQSMRTMKKQDVVEGYHQGVSQLGQGLAYINRGNVGQSFAWLSDHFTFVGVLMKQNELRKRLERLTALQGIGVHDFYCSMGENGYWTGGYFVPERTFSAIPLEEEPAYNLFSRQVIKEAEDEIQAHMSLFKPDKNNEYQLMVDKSTKLVVSWFNDDSEIVDDPKITEPEPSGSPENDVKATDEGVEVTGEKVVSDAPKAEEGAEDDNDLPDESPLDITAAASLAPIPDDASEGEVVAGVQNKQTYMKYLMGIAQQTGSGVTQAGTGLRGYIPSLPTVPSISKSSMPNVSMPSVSMPTLWGRKQTSSASETASEPAADEKEAKASEAGATAETKPEQAAGQAGGENAVKASEPETAVETTTDQSGGNAESGIANENTEGVEK